ncbi:sigma-70 family RNA polymerase sigma factor [Kitasatospora sp. NPDC004614]|uniref:sigma-70 family RNA polymerase sigma factor n=1 Tax=unclassified Kitasatospora TaxID=2633591 RepID=UPI003677F4FF
MTTLVGRAQHGDRQAVAELVGDHLPLVYNVVGRALSGHPDTDDVVQETMLRAVDGLPGLRDPAGFRSWLVAIALNQVRRRFRDEGDEGALREAPDAAAVADPSADFVGLTIVRLGLSEQRREVAEATRWLDEGDRDLLALWWLEAAGELSRAELAAALEVSPQHAAVRVQRMKGQLEAARMAVRALAAVPGCAWLAELTAGWDGVPSALWRKRIGRHVRECAVCGEHRRGLMPAEGLLAGLAMVPLPDGLSALPTGFAGGASSHRRAPRDESQRGGSHRAGSRHGRRAAARRGPGRVGLLVGGGVAAVAAGLLVAVVLPGSSPTSDGRPEALRQPVVAGAEQAEALAAPAAASAPASRSASASPSSSPSASPSASPSSKPTVSARPSSRALAPSTGKRAGDLGQQVLDLVNAQRAQAGCPALSANGQLAEAAQEQSDDMADREFFDHTNPDGEGPQQRIDAAGYEWSGWGENIARGQKDPAAVMASWMNSPGHRANILNCEFTELGVGVHQGAGGPWWTQDFGTPS